MRLSGLLLLLAVAAWPRSRAGHPDRPALGVATPAHLAVTTAARPTNDGPRPRATRPADIDFGADMRDDTPGATSISKTN